MKILLLETIHEAAVELLKQVGDVQLLENLEPEHVNAQFADAAAVLTRGRGRITRAALLAGRKLQCVARCGAGTDNIDVATATELKIPVLFSPAGTTNAVAEHALLLMLAVNRRLTLFDAKAKNGEWEFRNRTGLSAELYGKTLGVLGLGRIGARIAALGAAFGMQVVYWSARSRDERYAYVELEDLFRQADVLSVSLSLNQETRGFLNAARLALLKPTAIIVNTARGELLDEHALVAALKEKRLAGFGADVLAAEPPPANHPLFHCENVVITPHVAVWTDVTYRGMCVEVAEQVARVLKGARPDARNVRNPQVL